MNSPPSWKRFPGLRLGSFTAVYSVSYARLYNADLSDPAEAPTGLV